MSHNQAVLRRRNKRGASEAATVAADLRALDRAMVSSIAWTGAAKWTVQALSWISTIYVVHLLSPVDYGVVGMAGTFLAILAPLCDLGVGTAIVQGPPLRREQIERLNGLAVSLGAACTLLTALCAAPIADFYNEPVLRTVVPVMGFVFLCGSLKVVPTALIARDMGFRTLAALEAMEALCLLILTLSLALAGFGYWALAIGPVVSKAAGSIFAMLARPTRLGMPFPFVRIAGIVQFGAWVAMSHLAWYIYTTADQIVVGRRMGEAALGAYAIAMTLAALPMEKISQLYQRVAGSVIARVQHDRIAVTRYLLGLTEGVSMLSFPLTFGLALVADLFVPVVLGKQWFEAIVPLRLLAAAGAIRSLEPLLSQVLIATGHANRNARATMVAAVLLPLMFFAGARWGIAGIAGVWLVAYPGVMMALLLRVTLRVAGTSVSAYARALWPAVSSTALMALAIIGVRLLFADRVEPAAVLGVSVALGGVTYLAGIVTLHPHRLQIAWDFVRQRN